MPIMVIDFAKLFDRSPTRLEARFEPSFSFVKRGPETVQGRIHIFGRRRGGKTEKFGMFSERRAQISLLDAYIPYLCYCLTGLRLGREQTGAFKSCHLQPPKTR